MRMILRAVRELARAFAMVAACCFTLLALAAQGGRFSDRLDVLTHFTPIYLAGVLAATLVWIVTGRYGRTTPVLALIGTLSALTLMLPDLTAATKWPSGRVDGETLTIVQFNTWVRNRDPGATARWILKTDPDIVVVEEGAGESVAVLEALSDRYPSRTTCAAPFPCSTLILAKRKPVSRGGLSRDPLVGGLSGAWATFHDQHGAFTIVGAHYTWPIPAGPQQQQTKRLATVLNRFPKDRLIVAGDMNSTPWSFSLRRQDRLFGLERRTRAVASWPAGRFSELPLTLPFPVLPIDQVYAGKGWRTISVRRGPTLGSDHFPIVVTLAPNGDWTAGQRRP